MSWIDTSYEKAMKTYFVDKLDDTKGIALYSKYESIRNAMVEDNFFVEIKGKEPELSDHSQRHIQDVFERTYKVIGEDDFRSFNIYEIYCLALMVLFHDVGNIRGRKNHQTPAKIAEVYNKYRGANIENFREERRIIISGASAHTGKSKNGSNDTLKEVKADSFEGESIDLTELASILRFSDELAEGKQRSCSFLIEKKLIDEKSLIYHKYAQVSNIHIDRKLERISITYNIDINRPFNDKEKQKLKELIEFSFNRAVKLDIERRYTKNYSRIIKRFKYVSVSYNFSVDDIPIEMDLQNILFEDLYPIPGEVFKLNEQFGVNTVVAKNPSYSLDNLLKEIELKIN